MTIDLPDDMEWFETRENRLRHYLKVAMVVFAAWTAIGILNAFQRFANTADMRAQYPLWSELETTSPSVRGRLGHLHARIPDAATVRRALGLL